MRKLTAVLCTASVLSCGDTEPTGPLTELPRALTAAELELIQTGNSFTFKLFREVSAASDADSNVFISPLSVAMALGMTLNGAAGETEDAMRAALDLAGLTRDEINQSFRSLIDLLRGLDRQVEFEIANSIWSRAGFPFYADFMNVNQQYFDARTQELDFSSPAASATINDWVNQRTRGRIPSIVPEEIPQDLVMYLINAIYFKGAWTDQFDKSRTSKQPFHLAGGGTVSVDMMTHGRPLTVKGGRRDGVQLLELPYSREAFSMVVAAPDDPDDLSMVANTLSTGAWSDWISALGEGQAQVYLPRFSFSFDVTLNDALRALGMEIAFDENNADFSRMSPVQLFISEVKHKAFVEVNEEGTEAAAATSVGMMPTSAPPSITIDRPFVFAITERLSGTILFIGRVMNPTQN